jgi:hypothetical protein
MQGFVVRVFADKPSGDAKNSLTFRYDNLTHGNTQLRAARVTGPKVYTVVSLSETDGELKDRFWLFSDRNTTLGYDNGYDGYKIFGESTLARLYAKPDGRSYQVSAQPTIDNTWLFMKAASDVTDYTLTFHHGNLEERYDNIYLYDAVTKTTTNVTEDGSTYRFTADNVLSNDQRFLLTTTQNTTFIDETTADVYFNIYGSNGITIENGYPSSARVQVYSLQGQLLYTTEISAQSRETLSANFTSGIYIVRAVVGRQIQTAKIMLKDRN